MSYLSGSQQLYVCACHGHSRNLSHDRACVPCSLLVHANDRKVNQIRQLVLATGSEDGSLPGLVALEHMAVIQLSFQSHLQLQLTPPFPTSCSPDSCYLCVYPPPLSFPPLLTPSIPDHSSSYTCLPQVLLKQHSAVVVLMMVRRKAGQDKPRLSEISPLCKAQGWEFVWLIKWDSLDLKANQKFLPDLKYLRIKEFPLSSLSGSSV